MEGKGEAGLLADRGGAVRNSGFPWVLSDRDGADNKKGCHRFSFSATAGEVIIFATS
ncbi:MAG: hypothetical protein ACTHK8_11120 [Ginsengibacter sp.]